MMTHSLYKQSTSLLYLFNKPKCMKVASAPKPLNIPFVRKRRIKLRPKRQANCKDQQISSTESCSRQYICQCIQFTSRHSNFILLARLKGYFYALVLPIIKKMKIETSPCPEQLHNRVKLKF